jgi:predicted 2-oxoglutarate/Fe(II)-dependent dioxygenase YbiX/peroxiredoxin
MAAPTLLPGDTAPIFTAPTAANPRFRFDTVAGRYVVLSFFGSASDRDTAAMLSSLAERIPPFDDDHAAFFGVTADEADVAQDRLPVRIPGIRYFHDFDRAIAVAYGVAGQRCSFILDPNLRVMARLPFADPAAHAERLREAVSALPPLGTGGRGTPGAPVLLVPNLFERAFCRDLVAFYDRSGGEVSGFMQSTPDGRTVLVRDEAHKRRRDATIDDVPLREGVRARIVRRLVPQIRKAFQFEATRIERYIVACYDGGEGGHFRAHRDNTTKGTAHRRFAVTINLNAEDYDGGDLRFPEFGRDSYRAPTGGAIVFSCSLLHEATPVTRGQRYCCLPFLYDEAGAKIRQENMRFVSPEAATV